MFNKFSITTGVVLLSSVVLSAEQAQAIVYNFNNFSPAATGTITGDVGVGGISASGFFDVTDSSNDGVVDFPGELTNWEITLTNSNTSATSVLNSGNSEINQVVQGTGISAVTLPYLTGVSVTPTLLDFGTANNTLAGGFRIESTEVLLNDQLLFITTTNGTIRTSTETLIMTDSSLMTPTDIELTSAINGPLTLQATAVPFEFSPSLGLFVVGFTWWGSSRLKKAKFNSK